MTMFRYTAAREDGSVIEGRLEASSRDRVVRTLQTQGSTPIKIEIAADEATASGKTSLAWRPKQSNAATIDFFTLELSTLLRAGLPLAQALDTLSDFADQPALVEMIQNINKSVRGGKTFSDALEQSNAGFDRFYCNMVRAGESSGALDLALERLASFRAARREMRQSLTSALIYPAILLVMAILAVAVLLAFVVPQFTEMFADAGSELPLLTRIVAGAGELVTDWWWLMLGLLGALVWWIRKDYSDPDGRVRWDRWKLKVPLVGPFTQKLITARFTQTLSSLLENGVHLVPALDIARQIVGNTVVSQRLAISTQRVREGMSLAASLAEAGIFPPLATRLIRVGESSGRLEMMLAQVADIYEREVKASLKRLLTLAEPAIIITIALVITVIILSVVLMILESNDLAF